MPLDSNFVGVLELNPRRRKSHVCTNPRSGEGIDNDVNCIAKYRFEILYKCSTALGYGFWPLTAPLGIQNSRRY
jgi:hypothetical protein